jgi:3-methyladenine DNA glycosylase AlkC
MHYRDIFALMPQTYNIMSLRNALVKDTKFVNVGMGIYALKEKGYKQDSVANILADMLKDKSMTVKEIIKEFKKIKIVADNTITVSLYKNNKFEKVAKATYRLKK